MVAKSIPLGFDIVISHEHFMHKLLNGTKHIKYIFKNKSQVCSSGNNVSNVMLFYLKANTLVFDSCDDNSLLTPMSKLNAAYLNISLSIFHIFHFKLCFSKENVSVRINTMSGP